MNSAITDAVIKIEAAGNIVVVNTFSGMANAIAVCCDALSHDLIVGSVAGDDTIIIIARSAEAADDLNSRIKEIIRGQ